MAIDGTVRVPDAPPPVGPDTDGFYEVLAGAGRPVPGQGREVLARLRSAAQLVDEAPAALTQLGEDELTDLAGVLLRLQARAGQVATLAAADATERGTVDRSDAANTQQWVTGCAAISGVSVEPRDAKTMAVVAEACRDRRNQVVTAAVRDGSCTLTTARRVLEHTQRVAKLIPTASRQEIHGWFLQLDPAYGSRGVEELTRKLQAIYDPDTLEAEDAHLEDVESLTWHKLATGMWRLIADLSPAHAAILKQAITAMSAPQPAAAMDDEDTTDGNCTPTDDTFRPADNEGPRDDDGPDISSDTATGEGGMADTSADDPAGWVGDDLDDWFGTGTEEDHRNDHDDHGDHEHRAGFGRGGGAFGSTVGANVRDERLPGKRRLDALLDLVGAGAKVACGDGTGVGAAATVLLTMDLDALLTGIGGATTITGDVLDAGAARRLACDADLIPIVLGGPSQSLDVGRRERLVTKGMRAAVVLRDKGCSFPGCDRPPGFCEVHHLLPWWAGGNTSLTNSALLCCRHHQIVHRNGYYAIVTPRGVIWDLTKGAMPGWSREGYKATSLLAS